MELKEALEYTVNHAGGGKHFELPDGTHAVLVPSTMRVDKTPPLEKKLTRIRESVTLFDAPSFISYVNRFKTDRTRIFAVPGFLANGEASITAKLDYHGNAETPDYLAHSAVYKPRYSEEWKTWSAHQKLAQVAFAEHIEENRADITEPTAAHLLDIVRTFKATRKIEYDSVVYQANGDVTLGYSEQTQQSGAKGTSTVMPEKITVGIPVYFRDKRYAIEIFIRYRVGSGTVNFELKPDRLDIIENDAFTKLCEEIGKAVEIEPYLGRVG